jgi:hypothetical protein
MDLTFGTLRLDPRLNFGFPNWDDQAEIWQESNLTLGPLLISYLGLRPYCKFLGSKYGCGIVKPKFLWTQRLMKYLDLILCTAQMKLLSDPTFGVVA